MKKILFLMFFTNLNLISSLENDKYFSLNFITLKFLNPLFKKTFDFSIKHKTFSFSILLALLFKNKKLHPFEEDFKKLDKLLNISKNMTENMTENKQNFLFKRKDILFNFLSFYTFFKYSLSTDQKLINTFSFCFYYLLLKGIFKLNKNYNLIMNEEYFSFGIIKLPLTYLLHYLISYQLLNFINKNKKSSIIEKIDKLY